MLPQIITDLPFEKSFEVVKMNALIDQCDDIDLLKQMLKDMARREHIYKLNIANLVKHYND